MRRDDVQAFLQRPWDELRRAKDGYWIEQRERMSIDEAFELADSLRLSAIELIGEGFLADREEDLRDLIDLKAKLQRAHAAHRN